MKKVIKELKGNSGITLVALVVTVVILIILATISINVVINGGLIEKAEKGREITEREKKKEEDTLENIANLIERYSNNEFEDNTPDYCTYEYNEETKTAIVVGLKEEYANIENLVIRKNTRKNEQNYTITEIKADAFAGNGIIKSVRIPDTILNIRSLCIWRERYL